MASTPRPLALTLVFLAACPSTETPDPPQDATATDTGATDAPREADREAAASESDASMVSDTNPDDAADVNPFDPDASYPRFCDLPGSVLFTDQGTVVLPGIGTRAVDFMRMPRGFCVHYFGNLADLAASKQPGGNVRQLRFAPGGELFVASPDRGTTGGGAGGLETIMVLPDDNHDGLADKATVFLDALSATQGLLFTHDSFYYQNETKILRIPYRSGDRTPAAPPELVADTNVYYTSALHWPKAMDQSDDGTIFVANGSDQDEGSSSGPGLGAYCAGPRSFVGGILKLDGSPNGMPVAIGFRNPIAVRCQRGHNVCFAAELAKDYSADEGGREKLVPIRNGDDWGFPCCATKGVSHKDVVPPADCSKTTSEDVGFLIGDTPFGFDFERGKWAAPYAKGVFIALHGAAGSWTGARVVTIGTDPATGALLTGTSAGNGMSSGAMTDFIIGWDDGTHAHGRPASIEFAEDGRMFLGDDNTGNIYWIAPLDLPR